MKKTNCKEDYNLSNREKSQSPRKVYLWCDCDMNMVAPYQKCSVCGNRVGKFRLKRDSNS